MAPFLVTLNYAGPNSGGYKNCFNRTSAEGARVRALLEEKEKDQMAEVVGSTPEAAAAAVVAAEAFRRQLAATAGEGSGRDRVWNGRCVVVG